MQLRDAVLDTVPLLEVVALVVRSEEVVALPDAVTVGVRVSAGEAEEVRVDDAVAESEYAVREALDEPVELLVPDVQRDTVAVTAVEGDTLGHAEVVPATVAERVIVDAAVTVAGGEADGGAT